MRNGLANHSAEMLGLDVGQVNEGWRVGNVRAPWLVKHRVSDNVGRKGAALPYRDSSR